MTITQRVAAGAAWLDENKPGWEKTINLDMLDMGSMTKCILGQAFTNYFEVVAGFRVISGVLTEFAEGKSEAWAEEHGFQAEDLGAGEYDALALVWHALIKSRREATPSPIQLSPIQNVETPVPVRA